MTQFPDGADYSYISRFSSDGLRCVGWLGREDDLPRGEVPSDFVDRLAWYCLHQPERQTRGFHTCELCPPEQNAVVVLRSGEMWCRLGSAEITVATSTTRYAAPNLILHYVTAHQYHPPAEFIDAVMSGPPNQMLLEWTLAVDSE